MNHLKMNDSKTEFIFLKQGPYYTNHYWHPYTLAHQIYKNLAVYSSLVHTWMTFLASKIMLHPKPEQQTTSFT